MGLLLFGVILQLQLNLLVGFVAKYGFGLWFGLRRLCYGDLLASW